MRLKATSCYVKNDVVSVLIEINFGTGSMAMDQELRMKWQTFSGFGFIFLIVGFVLWFGVTQSQAQMVQQVEQVAEAVAEVRMEAEPAEAVEDAEEAEVVEGEQEDVDQRITLRVFPQSISINQSMHFDEQGNMRGDNRSMSLNFNAFYTAKTSVVSYRILKVDPLVTSSGEKLELTHSHFSERTVHRHHNNQQRFYFNFNVAPPTLAAAKIEKVSGEVEIKMGQGPMLTAVLGPLGEVEGKTARIEGVEGCRVRVQRQDNGQLRVDFMGNGWTNMKEVRFFNGQGIQMNPNGWGGGSAGHGNFNRTYHLNMDDDGRVAFDLWSGMEKITVPFEVKDIPMPGAIEDDAIDLAIKAVPSDELDDADFGGGLPEGNVDVIIEEEAAEVAG